MLFRGLSISGSFTVYFLYVILLLLSLLTDIFLGEHGLAGTQNVFHSGFFSGANDDGGDGDNWSYKTCKTPVRSSPPTPSVLQAGCPSCCPTNHVRALKEKTSHSMDLIAPSSPGVFRQRCLWPLKAPGHLGGGLPCLLWTSDASTPVLLFLLLFYSPKITDISCWWEWN